MHAPTGSSGVQRRPNSAHSAGSVTPRSTSPQRQPVGSSGSSVAIVNRRSASNPANASRTRRPEPAITPSPRQSASHGSKTRSMSCRATTLPSARTARPYWMWMPGAFPRTSMSKASRTSAASKPATTPEMP